MRVLLDLGHPAHFHLFRNAVSELQNTGDNVTIVARPKDVLLNLLDQAGLEYVATGGARKGMWSMARNLWATYRSAARLAKQHRFDLMVGTSVVAAPLARRMGSTSVIFNEDDAKAVPLFARMAYPLAHYIATPQCLAFENYGRRHLTYPGYHELAYLHPNRFTPDPAIRKRLGIEPAERYFLVRLVALTAHHDVGQKGLTTRQAGEIVRLLQPHGRVFISAERIIDEQLRPLLLPTPPEAVLDVLAGADIVIGDSQTMTAEAAVLGTPALRCNTFVGRLSYLEELEHRWKLTKGIRPEAFEQLVATLKDWLSRSDLKSLWASRRQAMLAESVDVTRWMVDVFRKLGSSSHHSPADSAT